MKNKLQLQYLKPKLPDRPPSDDAPCNITESPRDKKDGGSIFRGYCAGVTCLNDVAEVKQYLMCAKPEVAKASHLIYAYRFESRGKLQENFDSDRDAGTGHELLKMMRINNLTNVICLATRHCNPGYLHLGKKRFTYINEACLQAHKSLN